MNDFDPYLKWLGIRESTRPPNHYRLLGIELFEDDKDVIAAAVERQSTFVRSFQNSEHHQHALQILSELEVAKTCLLDRPAKLAYDERLHSGPLKSLNPIPNHGSAFPELIETAPDRPGHNRKTRDNRWRSEGVSSESTAPAIRTKPKRANAGRVWIMLFAWVSSGAAAIFVASWIIDSGFLDQFRSEHVLNEPGAVQAKNRIARKPELEKKPPKDLALPKPDQNKPIQHKPGPAPVVEPEQAIINKENIIAPMPWDGNRFPEIPHLLLTPDSEIDSLLQATRAAIAVRDFDRAEKEWNRVSNRSKRLDRSTRVGQMIVELKGFWAIAMTRAQRLGPGDSFVFRGVPVQVFRATAKGISVRVVGHENQTKYFPIDIKNIDRDLVAAVAEIDNTFDRMQIKKYLQMDFAHDPEKLDQILALAESRNTAVNDADPNSDPNPKKRVAVLDPGRPFKNPADAIAPPPAKKKLPVPADEVIVDSRRIVKQLFPEGYGKLHSTTAKQGVAREMIRRSSKSTNNPEHVFALLSESANIAQSIGDGATGLKALENLKSQFQIDYWDLVRSFVVVTTKNADTVKQKVALTKLFRSLTVNAIKEKQYDFAKFLAHKATTITSDVGSRSEHDQAVLLKNETKELARLATRANQARLTLKANPDNGKANSDLGTFLCLVENDFEKGLENWTNSSVKEERLIAVLEQKIKTAPAENSESQLGDAWFELGKDKKTFRDAQCLARAKFWKELALEKVEGLYRKKLETEIDEIEALLNKLPSVIAARDEN